MSNQTKLLLTGVPLLVVLVFLVKGCGHYGEVNEVTYEHAKALFSVCNRKDSKRLEVCADMIKKAAASEELSSVETSYLTGIIEAARNDQWKEALAMSRQLMVDQVEH